MAILRSIIVLCLCVLPEALWACPACLKSDAGGFSDRILITGVMWLVPILLALFVGLKVYRLCTKTQELTVISDQGSTDMTLGRKKDLAYDGICWFFVVVFLSMLAWSMMQRDVQKQYGAVAFGNFPAFVSTDSSGKLFDQHQLHGQLSVVIISEGVVSEEVLGYLRKLSQATAQGRKYLNSLVFVAKGPGLSDKWVRYLTLDGRSYPMIVDWKNGVFKKGVILVDQNAVIRGVFDLEDKMDRLNFEGAVRGIL